MIWKGVMPAITTCFDEDLQIDHGFLAEHCRWLLDNGCSGNVVLGSLGEGATLSFDERVAIVRTAVKAVHRRRDYGAGLVGLAAGGGEPPGRARLVEVGAGDLRLEPDARQHAVARGDALEVGEDLRLRREAARPGRARVERERIEVRGDVEVAPGYVLSRQVPPRRSAFSKRTTSSKPARASWMAMPRPPKPLPTMAMRTAAIVPDELLPGRGSAPRLEGAAPHPPRAGLRLRRGGGPAAARRGARLPPPRGARVQPRLRGAPLRARRARRRGHPHPGQRRRRGGARLGTPELRPRRDPPPRRPAGGDLHALRPPVARGRRGGRLRRRRRQDWRGGS